jgi:hypothetical protein
MSHPKEAAMGAFHFLFKRGVSLADAEMSLHLAMFAVEGLVGQARVRLGAKYILDQSMHSIVINGGDGVCEMVAKVFTSLLTREFGEDSFYVEGSEKSHELQAA